MTGLSYLSNASQGIHAWMQAFDRSAASVNTAAAQLSTDTASTTNAGQDLVDAMVGLRLAASGVKANVAVARTADEMLGSLLDMHA